jgi:hypothetical protein
MLYRWPQHLLHADDLSGSVRWSSQYADVLTVCSLSIVCLDQLLTDLIVIYGLNYVQSATLALDQELYRA